METTLHSLAGSQAVIAWIFIITGSLAAAFALFFLLIIKYSFFKGLAIVLLCSGILQISYGSFTSTSYRETPDVMHSGSPDKEEEDHIRHKISMLSNLTPIMLAALALGTLLFITFFRSAQTFWKGIGLGLIIQGALSAALFQAEIMDLKSYKASVTQALAIQDKCRKKIDEGRNW